ARAPRPPGGDRRDRAQARLSFLVPAHARGGLRVRAAVLDEEEVPPARAHRRRRARQGEAGSLVDQQGAGQSRARARRAGRGRLPAARRRLAVPEEKEGRGCPSGARLVKSSSVEETATRQESAPDPAL